jgi:hypothetical protein
MAKDGWQRKGHEIAKSERELPQLAARAGDRKRKTTGRF